jgi:hypothetical protein
MGKTRVKLPPGAHTYLKNVLRSVDRNMGLIPPEWRNIVIEKIQERLDEWKEKHWVT